MNLNSWPPEQPFRPGSLMPSGLGLLCGCMAGAPGGRGLGGPQIVASLWLRSCTVTCFSLPWLLARLS